MQYSKSSDPNLVLPEFKDNKVFSAWNYAEVKGGRRRKSKKIYKRHRRVTKGRRTRNHY